jgi:sporulation protein YlmC with PRC-barrel domain
MSNSLPADDPRTTEERACGDGPGLGIMSAHAFEGDTVVNLEGEDLGKILSIMLDVPRGQVAYAVLSFGGFLGMGNKLFAVPWPELAFDTDRKCFVLDVDKELLERAPGFDKDHWPSLADLNFAVSIHWALCETSRWHAPMARRRQYLFDQRHAYGR